MAPDNLASKHMGRRVEACSVLRADGACPSPLGVAEHPCASQQLTDRNQLNRKAKLAKARLGKDADKCLRGRRCGGQYRRAM